VQPGEQPPFVEVTPAAEANVKGEIRYLMFAILVCCFFVLLIACANLANLTLARTARRLHELGIRAALGGTRWRLIWVLLEENLVLSLAGSALGVALASVVLDVFTGLLNQEAQLTGGGVSSLAFTIDAAVLAFVLLLSVSTALASGIVPALRATAGEIEQVLRSGSKALTPRSGRFVGTLIQVQLAASVLLLVGTGAMASLTAQFGAGVTYDPAKILSARIDLGGDSTSTLQYLPAALTAYPDIVAAAFTTAEHIERVPSAAITAEAGASERNSDGARARLQGVSPGYFDVFGSRLLAGRPFDARDTASAPKTAIVNLAFAKRYWPRTDAVGRRFHIDSPQGQPVEWLTVVGVVEDIGSIKDSAHQRTPAFYRPIPQMEIAELSIVARHRTEAGRIMQPLIGAMKARAVEYPLFQVYTAEQIMQMESIGTRIPALLLAACGLCGLILSAIGAYGVLSLSVKQRTREIGIRLALGAAPNAILRATFAQGLNHVALGITFGLIGGLVLTRVLASLFGSLTMQVGVNVAVVMIMAVVGITAVAIPARAASRLEPTIALRD
jgi:predicted permease